MNFMIPVAQLRTLISRTHEHNSALTEYVRYGMPESRRVTVPFGKFLPGEIETLQEIVKASLKVTPDAPNLKSLLDKLNAYFDLAKPNTDGDVKVKKLELLAIALKSYIETSAPHRWLFKEDTDKILLPHFVDSIVYEKRKRDRHRFVTPASVTLTLKAYEGREINHSKHYWHEEDLPATLTKLLHDAKFYVETEAAVKNHTVDLQMYEALQGSCGQQKWATGFAYSVSNRWYDSSQLDAMIKDGEPSKIVLDPSSPELVKDTDKEADSIVYTTFWDDKLPLDSNGIKSKADTEDEEGESEKGLAVALPRHPYIYCFSLSQHKWLNIHVSYIQDYPWDKTLFEKLILPTDHKDLINILIRTTGASVEDIVRGKMSGVIVLATGLPGTGKTLTAEVFSEHIERPLYVVQCSQLGLDVTNIEQNLAMILKRASRWGAVLLIDEADVYIRKRGDDLEQNAIVGIFLRLLEYYRGVLFMASNRGNMIDDAILSRATAWLQYEVPSVELSAKIWAVLAKQYRITLTATELTQLVEKDLAGISGRSIRNILKLANTLEGNKATHATIVRVSKYQALEEKEK